MKTQILSKGIIASALALASLVPVIAGAQSYLTYPDNTPPWVTRWAVTDVTAFSATINWSTDEPATGMVEFCTSWAHCNNFTPNVANLTIDHVINLSGLTPYTRYYFYMYSTDQFGNQRVYGYWTFTTAWNGPVVSPSPLPTPQPSITPYPSPLPSPAPLPTRDVTAPWPIRWSATNITPFAATINWTTNELSDSQIEFCTSWVHCGNFTPLVTNMTTEHQINLSGLNSYTRYYIYMYSRDAAGNRMMWGYKTFMTTWAPPVVSPTPLPSPVVPTPTPTPYPSQTPLPSPDTTAPWLIYWPIVSSITTTTARIEWVTNENSSGLIEFCPTWVHCANYTPLVSELSTRHIIDLSGLTPGKRYYYWAYSRDAAGNLGTYGYRTFNTAWY